MKLATAWWGCQFLAETDEDKEILENLIAALPDGPVQSYEQGGIEVLDPNDYKEDVWSFNVDEVKAAKMVVEIQR